MDMVFDDSRARALLGPAGITLPAPDGLLPAADRVRPADALGQDAADARGGRGGARRGVNRRDELHDRLDRYSRFGSGPELDRLASETEGQELVAAFAVRLALEGLGRRGDRRRPVPGTQPEAARAQPVPVLALGGPDVRAHGATMSVSLAFASEEVELKLLSHDEFVALLEVARGPLETSASELRELARVKLGKTLAFGYEATIDALPDRLEPDERVERLAIGTLEFTGMLVVTDRRLLLVDRGLRAERFWEAPRTAIRGLSLTEAGFRLALDSGEVDFREVLPLDRRDELAAVLRP